MLGSGATGRSTATVHTHYSTEVLASLAWQSLQIFRSFDDIIGVSTARGQSGFTETGHLVFAGRDRNSQIKHNVELQQQVGARTSIINQVDAVGIAPGFQLDDCEAISYEPLSGYADASGTTLAFASRARQLGVRTELMTTATGLEIDQGKISAVLTNQGRISTTRVIITPEPGAGIFFCHTESNFRCRCRDMRWLRSKARLVKVSLARDRPPHQINFQRSAT